MTRVEANRWLLGNVELVPSYWLGFTQVVLAKQGEDDLLVKLAVADTDVVVHTREERELWRTLAFHEEQNDRAAKLAIVVQVPDKT